MRRRDVQSDELRLTHLKTILTNRDLTGPSGQPILPERHLTKTEQLTEALETALRLRNEALTEWRATSRARRYQQGRLLPLIRASWDNLVGQVKAGLLPESELVRYGLGATGKRPRPAKIRAWLELAQPLIESAVLVIDKEAFLLEMDKARNAEIEAEQATAALRERRNALAAIRAEVDEHLCTTAMQIRTRLYGTPRADQRNAMRILGYRFRAEPTQPQPEQQPS